ncbi:MAG: WbqC family protein [Flavobacteriales bacterium]
MLPACPFPSIHWVRMALEQDPATIYVHEHYIKQTFRNRYQVLSSNGVVALTIPVEGQKGQKTMTKDIRIADHTWVKNHLAAIRSAYARSACYEFFEDEIVPVFEKKHAFMVDFSLASIAWMGRYIPQLKVETSSKAIDFLSISEEDQKRLLAFEPSQSWPLIPAYPQVFGDRFAFQSNLSTLDLLMNLGPRAADYILFTKNREQDNK